jgi:hypothetical protein
MERNPPRFGSMTEPSWCASLVQVSITYGSYSTWYLTRSGFSGLSFCKKQWNSIFAFLPNYHRQKPVSNSKLSEWHLDGEKSPHFDSIKWEPDDGSVDPAKAWLSSIWFLFFEREDLNNTNMLQSHKRKHKTVSVQMKAQWLKLKMK